MFGYKNSRTRPFAGAFSGAFQRAFWITLTLLLFAGSASADFRDIVSAYDRYDLDGDGRQEIENLDFVFAEDEVHDTAPNAKIMVVFVDERLLYYVSGAEHSTQDLRDRLSRWRTDLRAEGYTPKFLKARVYDGAEHQDGLTVLALREVLRATANTYPLLSGSVLVGSFPDAMVVRSILWRKNDDRLQVKPEVVARRSDLVLADLDGRWEDIYIQEPTDIPSFNAVELTVGALNPDEWPCNGCVVESRDFIVGESTFEDFFWVQDDRYRYTVSGPIGAEVMTITMDEVAAGPELAFADQYRVNQMAVANIAVSRINPRQIAVIPDPDFRDIHGNGWLDAQGKPQSVQTSESPEWVRDASLERRLLIEYLDRNHQHRAGENPAAFRVATTNFPEDDFALSSLTSFMSQAAADFQPPYERREPELPLFAHWLRKSAVLKGIHTHANRTATFVGNDYNLTEIEAQVGPEIWNWVGNGQMKQPMMWGMGDQADQRLYYSMWRNNVLANTGGTFYLHNGCDVASPAGAETLPFQDADYGYHLSAENFIFYLNGLAMIARSKDFNDRPEGFTAALDDSPTTPWGAGWLRQFEVASQDGGLAGVDIQRKRSYNWVLLGDWTLALRPTETDEAVVAYDGLAFSGPSAKLEIGRHESQDFPFTPSNVDSVVVPDNLELRMFHGENGVGRYATVRGDMADVDDLSFNDWLNSAVVRPRQDIGVTLYSSTGYSGARAFLPPGHYTYTQIANSFGINPRTVSSMKLDGVEVFIYDRQAWWNNWRGFSSSVYNLATVGWNDRMESIVIYPRDEGAVAYEHNYGGRHVILEPGAYDQEDLEELGFTGGWGISSIYVGPKIKLRAYAQTGFRGTPLVLDGVGRGNLQEIGWNDVIRSVVVEMR
ncbi:MAG: hypothetical protein AAF604_06180 [Acidobacteriota bacterium]